MAPRESLSTQARQKIATILQICKRYKLLNAVFSWHFKGKGKVNVYLYSASS